MSTNVVLPILSFVLILISLTDFPFCSFQPPVPPWTLTLTLREPLLLLLFLSAFAAHPPPRAAASPRSSELLSSSALTLLLKRLWRVSTARVHRTYMALPHRCSSRGAGGFISGQRSPPVPPPEPCLGRFSLTAVLTLFNPFMSSVSFPCQLFHPCPESRSLPANAALPKN